MMNATLCGKSHSGNPHARFTEREDRIGKPRHGSLLNTKVKAVIASGFAALALASFADIDAGLDMPAPETADSVYCINSKLNIVCLANDTTDQFAEYVKNKVEDGFVFDVQVKPVDAPDSDANWVDVSGEFPRYGVSRGDQKDITRFFWRGALSLEESMLVRARFRVTKAASEKQGSYSQWKNMGTVVPVAALNGTVIGNVKADIDHLSDGDASTYCEQSDRDDEYWTGFDFGTYVLVSGFRFVPRASMPGRMASDAFQVADDADFTVNVRTLYTVPSADITGKVYSVALDAPVFGRYFRHKCNSKYDYANIAELEFAGCRAPAAPNVSHVGFGDFRAVVSGTVPASATSAVVQYAYQPEGPWATLGAVVGAAEAFCVTDTVTQVGVSAYYRLLQTTDGVSIAGVHSSRYVRGRVLERESETATRVRTGVEVLVPNLWESEEVQDDMRSYCTGNGRASGKHAFDGSYESYPKMYCSTALKSKKINGVVGVALPENAYVTGLEFYCQTDANARARQPNAVLCASVDREAYTNQSVFALSEMVGEHDEEGWIWLDSNNQDVAYECVYLYCTNGSAWCGHVAEASFIGWTRSDEDASGVVRAPTSCVACVADGGISVSWSGAVNATSMTIERRVQGETEWTVVATGADPNVAYVDTAKLSHKLTYEYRVTAVGLGGMMTAVCSVVPSVQPPAPGLILIFR